MFSFIHPGYFLRSSPSLPGLSKRLARTGRCQQIRNFPGVRPALEYQFTEQEMLCVVAKAKK
jgi:hypothetical protein